MNNMEAAKKRRKGKCMHHVPFVLGVASPIMGVSPDTSSCLPRLMRENGELVAAFGAGLYMLSKTPSYCWVPPPTSPASSQTSKIVINN